MSISVEGQTCPVCHAYLFDEDDVVYCPICGAPHHRACYQAIGHCAYEDKHDTDEGYHRPAPADAEQPPQDAKQTADVQERCRRCGRPLDATANVCPYCGLPRQDAPFPPGGAPFGMHVDLLGGVPPETRIEDATAEEVRRFTLLNSQRYVPKFAALSGKKRLSWNWAAFLLPHGWFFFRKMYRSGVLVMLLHIAATVCTFPLLLALEAFAAANQGGGALEIANFLMRNLGQIGAFPLVMYAVGGVLDLLLRIFCGLFGDSIYRSFTLSRIREIKEEQPDDPGAEFSRRGNVSPLMFAVALMAATWLPNVLLLFLS